MGSWCRFRLGELAAGGGGCGASLGFENAAAAAASPVRSPATRPARSPGASRSAPAAANGASGGGPGEPCRPDRLGADGYARAGTGCAGCAVAVVTAAARADPGRRRAARRSGRVLRASWWW